MYENSLLAMSTRCANFYLFDVQDVRVYQKLQGMVGSGPVSARDPSVYEFSQETIPVVDFGLFAPRRDCSKELLDTTTRQTLRTLLLPCLVWVRNMAALVYRNIMKMQNARYTAGSLSVIVLPEAESPIVEMRSVEIQDVERMVEALDFCVSELQRNGLSSSFRHFLGYTRHCCERMMRSLTPSSATLTAYIDALNKYANEVTGLMAGSGPSQAMTL